MWYNDKSIPMENRQFSKNKNSVEPDFKRMHKCASKHIQQLNGFVDCRISEIKWKNKTYAIEKKKLVDFFFSLKHQ